MRRIFLMAIILVSTAVKAEEAAVVTETADASVVTQQAPAPAAAPKLKAAMTTYYYDFEGNQGDKHSNYSFSDATLGMQLATVQYEISPKLTVMVLAQRLDNYVETNIFGMRLKDRTTGTGDTLVAAVSS